MTGLESQGSDKPWPSATARAEAAVWIARLHGPNRTSKVEEGLRRWQTEDPERAAAFELLTDVWEKSARLRRNPLEEVVSWRQLGVRISFLRAVVAMVVVGVVAALVTAFFLRDGGYSSSIGEQRMIALRDGTRIYLNTDSRARVHYSRDARRVELVRGEALFEVAKRPNWPFIVSVGKRRVRALGTAFDVRTDRDAVAITLVEGKVTVWSTPQRVTRPPEAPGRSGLLAATRATGTDSYTLTPGERLSFIGDRSPQVDYPSINAVTAWRVGRVQFDNAPLSDAVAEMNRYSEVRLYIEDPRAALMRVSGIFTVGDSEEFAEAIARLYQLTLRNEPKGIVLGRGGASSPGGAPP